jgi:galactokinase/mevalonate kinase-like predicted kinase
LSYEQIAGKGEYDIRLYKAQKEKLDESIKLKEGFVLELDHEQIKTGGFIPALIAAITSIIGIFCGLGAAAGGVTAIVNSVKTAKRQNAEEEEINRHNLEMEKNS